MKLKQILKENSAYIHFDKAHPNSKPHTWGGSSLNENYYNIKKIVRAIKAKNVDPDLVSPNYVADVADEKKIQLSSTDIVYISDNYEKLLKEETTKEKRKLLFGQEDKNEIELTDEIKQKFLEAVKSFNKYGESIYREANLKEAMEEICEIGKLAEKIALSETDDWFDSVSVQRDVKSLNEDVKLFEKTCNEVNQLQQRLESCFESIGQRLGKYFEIQGNEEKPMHESKINRKLIESTYRGIDINNLIVRNDFGSPVRKIDHLVLNQDYIIHEYGMNQWMGYMRYLGIKSGEHKFKSSYQNDEFDMSFTTAELNELIHDDDIYEQL